MKKNLFIPVLVLGFLAIIQFSCKKNEAYSSTETANSSSTSTAKAVAKGSGDNKTPDREDGGSCTPTITALIAGQTILSGSVTVTNDADYIYVTYATANGYTLKETHLYVGDCNAIPTNNNGNPVPGAFPYAATHENVTTYTYQVPIATIGINLCGCIASHAVVEKLDASGNVIDRQTAWGDGQRFVNRGNWATKFPYCTCW